MSGSLKKVWTKSAPARSVLGYSSAAVVAIAVIVWLLDPFAPGRMAQWVSIVATCIGTALSAIAAWAASRAALAAESVKDAAESAGRAERGFGLMSEMQALVDSLGGDLEDWLNRAAATHSRLRAEQRKLADEDGGSEQREALLESAASGMRSAVDKVEEAEGLATATRWRMLRRPIMDATAAVAAASGLREPDVLHPEIQRDGDKIDGD